MVFVSLFKNGFVREPNSSCFWRTEQRAKCRGECSHGRPARRAPVCTNEGFAKCGRRGGTRKGSAGLILDGTGEHPHLLTKNCTERCPLQAIAVAPAGVRGSRRPCDRSEAEPESTRSPLRARCQLNRKPFLAVYNSHSVCTQGTPHTLSCISDASRFCVVPDYHAIAPAIC